MLIHSRRQPLSRRLLPYLLAFFTACSLVVFTAGAALANTVEIYDDSRVLNTSQVRSDASSLSDPIRIYTTTDYANSNSSFDQATKQKINTSHTLVIAINTLSHHLAIVGGSSAGLSSSQYQDAVSAFTSHFSSGGYTGATIAAIDSLKSALKGGGFGSILLGALCCVVLLLVIGGSVFGFVRRRSRGNVAPTFAPNYGAPNYGPGAYPQQQGGMNPWVAGGLGAAGGGFVGYELGKMEGEREARREMEGQGYYGGGNFGDAGGFGGGASGDFGGGGDNFGGGNFGGGGDNFGGGGDNFGGGGGDNFGGGDNGGGGNF